MKTFLMAAAFVAAFAAFGLAGEVVIPEDKVPFKVAEKDVVRIAANGIAGTQVKAKVKAKVKGPAKATVNSVTARVKGRMPIGPGNHEVDVKPTGKGKVTVEITLSPPNGPATTETYEFDVE